MNFLALAAVPMLFSAFGGGATGLAMSLLAFALVILAVWLTRTGIDAHEAYEARSIARRPAIPRKIFGAASIGLGVGLATVDTSLGDGILYGLIASALHLTAFGLDPMRDKSSEGVNEFQTDRVARAVDQAEGHLRAMQDAIKVTDRVLTARVDQFQASARAMFRRIEQDPRDLTSAKKYLGVYLKGARDATRKFADVYAESNDPEAKAKYLALLDDLEANFTAKTQALLGDSRTDLDIEIDVLRERLGREGVRLPQGD